MWAAMLWALGLGSAPQGVEPQETRVDLVWKAPAPCPAAADVTKRIEQRLGQPAPSPSAPTARAEVTVEHNDGDFVAGLLLTTSRGTYTYRLLRASSCEVVADAAALIIASTLDPSATHDVPPDARGSVTVDGTVRPVRNSPEGTLRAAGVLGAGAMPGLNYGGTIAAGVVWRPVRAELFAAFRTGRDARLEGADAAGAALQLWTVGLRGCPVVHARRIEVPLCLGFEAGPMRAEGVGLASPAVAYRPWVAIVAEPAVLVRATPHVAPYLAIDVAAAVLRPRFDIGDEGEVYRAGVLAAGASAGIEVRFP